MLRPPGALSGARATRAADTRPPPVPADSGHTTWVSPSRLHKHWSTAFCLCPGEGIRILHAPPGYPAL